MNTLPFRIEFFGWSCWVNATMSFGMVALVLFSRPMTRLKLLWGLTCISVGIWSIGIGKMTFASSYPEGLIGTKILYLGANFIPVLLYHTTLELVQSKRRDILFFLYGFAILLVYFSITGDMCGVRPILGFEYYTSANWAYWLFLVYFYTGFFVLWATLFAAARRASQPMRKQYYILLIGSGLGVLGGQTTIPLVYDIPIFPYGIFFTPIYLIVVAYGMFRYQMMDIKVAFQKFVLSILIYLTLLMLSIPILLPLWRTIKTQAPRLLSELSIFIILATLIFISGPFIYSYLIRRSYWLRGHESSGLAHEMKSPLASILSSIEIIKENRSKIDEYLPLMERNATKLHQFVGDLLNVAKIQEEHVQLKKEKIDISELISETTNRFTSSIHKKGLKLKITGSSPMPIEIDREKIEQVISNLISNAIKFSEKGTIHIEHSQDKSNQFFSIQDEGIGISAGDLERIFDRFFQADTKQKGSGIGLSIAKAWIEIHGGKIWTDSKGLEKGTKISFFIPFLK